MAYKPSYQATPGPGASLAQAQRAYQAAAQPRVAAKPAVKPPGPGTGGAGPVTDAPIPGVAAYGAEMAKAQAAYNNAVAYTKGTLTNNLQQLGFGPDGSVQGLNPYGAYQQNRRVGGLNAETATNNSVGRGLGAFGGLADQQRNDATFQAGAGMSGILGQANQANLDATAGIQSAGDTLQQRLVAAQQAAAQQAIEDRAFTTAAQPGPAGAPAAGAGKLVWAGQQINNKAQLTKILAKSDVSYATWAKNHPAAAKNL